MKEWKARTIEDRQCQYPDRYEIYDSTSGAKLYTCDIRPLYASGDKVGTRVNKQYLQPLEDYLQEWSRVLVQLEKDIAALQSAVAQAQARSQKAVTDMSALAPLQNPVFTSPSANTVPITKNDGSLATTAAVKTYLDGLMAAYRQV